MTKKSIKLSVEIEVPFNSYPTERLNRKARSEIKSWIKETIYGGLSYVPMYVERDENGAAIEDCFGKTKIKIQDVSS